MRLDRRTLLLQGAAAAASFAAPPLPRASTAWPSRPIRIVVPVPPGGSLDVLARTIAKELSGRLGQQVLVDNVAGGGSNIAFGQVAKSAPDGYTLLLGWDSLVINPGLYPSIPYRLDQFAPITLAITAPQVFVVGAKSPLKSLRGLLDEAAARPGALTMANAGSGSPGHLAATLLESSSGVRFTHVPYKGGAPAVTDLLAGHVDALAVTLPAAIAPIRAGRLVALGVSSPRRATGVPEIPTVSESGVVGYELNSWQGLLAPTGTPQPVIELLSRHIVDVLRDRTVSEHLVHQGFEIVGSTPEAFDHELKRLAPRWARLARESGARVE